MARFGSLYFVNTFLVIYLFILLIFISIFTKFVQTWLSVERGGIKVGVRVMKYTTQTIETFLQSVLNKPTTVL